MDPVHAADDGSPLTVRALLAGCLIGGLLSVANVYMALKTGLWEGGFPSGAIVAFALVGALARRSPRPYSAQENLVSQAVDRPPSASRPPTSPLPRCRRETRPRPACSSSVQRAGDVISVPLQRLFACSVLGIAAGAPVCEPAYLLVTRAHRLGNEALPVPPGRTWKAVTGVVTGGGTALPAGPAGMDRNNRLGPSLASGAIAGESLMGVTIAILITTGLMRSH